MDCAGVEAPPGGGGGYLGIEWIPTAKRPLRVEAVNIHQSVYFLAK